MLAVLCLFSYQISQAQLCSGVKGPNLLGAKGTFSAPYITVNNSASSCLANGSSTYNPIGNVGNALTGCSTAPGDIIPCSDYTYTASTNGMIPEFRYSLLKVMGDENGSNCIHTVTVDQWKAKDHTQDGGYFLAVNGAPNTTTSSLFYQIKHIPVCVGTSYEFSAWVLSMVPGANGSTGPSSPNISFVVNGVVIANSGPIPYSTTGAWVQVGGSFTATIPFVDLQVINATAVAGGNDLGLDDISIRVCQSKISPTGPEFNEVNSTSNPQFVVSDPLDQNTWYKWQLSTDGGVTFTDETNGEQATFNANHTYTVSPMDIIGVVAEEMNGFIYQLAVSTSKQGLNNPECIYFNSYRLIVVPEGSPMPVQLTSFDGTCSDGTATLKWQTSQEINSDRFELLRSYDGTHFELATSVKSAGNSNTIRDYQYEDRVSGNAGKHVFYKLKQIDKDGQFSFSDVIKLALDDFNAKFQLFPNPVVNNFTASFSAPKSATATLLIRNTNGQTVYSKTVSVLKGNNAVVINNAPLTTGMYYVTIGNDDFHYNGKLQKK